MQRDSGILDLIGVWRDWRVHHPNDLIDRELYSPCGVNAARGNPRGTETMMRLACRPAHDRKRVTRPASEVLRG